MRADAARLVLVALLASGCAAPRTYDVQLGFSPMLGRESLLSVFAETEEGIRPLAGWRDDRVEEPGFDGQTVNRPSRRRGA